MKTFRRKRDGMLYLCSMTQTQHPKFDWGPCYLLRPVWEGRVHYKSVAAFEREYQEVLIP